MMLADLGRCKNNVAGLYLVEVVNDPKAHDVIRYYAARGISEMFPAREFTRLDLANPALVERKKNELPRVEALIKFIERPSTMAANADESEVEAFRFMRREAIKALATSCVAAVEVVEVDKKGTPAGAAAPTLLRVLANDGFNPPVSLTEKIEAAMGICFIKAPANTTYDPDLGIYLLGRFLAEYGKGYSTDLPRFRVAKEERPLHPWRFHSARLKKVLEEHLVNNLTIFKPASKKNAEQLAGLAAKLFSTMDRREDVNTHITALENFAGKIRPATAQVFTNVPPLALKLE
jgi:hypothetical protein